MEFLGSLLTSGPVTVLVVSLMLIALHKTGALEVVLSFISKKANVAEGMAQDGISGLGVKMDRLAGYYNHDTTKLLEDIRDELRDINQYHKNYEIIGIKTRDCASHVT